MLAVVNGGGAALIGWRQTNGYGLVGQVSPWNAMDALIATSCLSSNDFYTSGSRTVGAKCPSGPNADMYSGAHDEGGFANQLCDPQPRAAFQVWWDRVRHYQAVIVLDFGGPGEWQLTVDGQPVTNTGAQQPGQTATIGLTVRVAAATRLGATSGPDLNPVSFDKDSENWSVTAKRTVLGGWKICTIDVPDPIHTLNS